VNDHTIKHEGHTWQYKMKDVEQGAYTLFDPQDNKTPLAVIIPAEIQTPIHRGGNAWLHTLDFHAKEMVQRGNHDLETAMSIGGVSANRYQEDRETLLKAVESLKDDAGYSPEQRKASEQNYEPGLER